MNKTSESKDLIVVREKIKGMQAMLDSTQVTTDAELDGVADKIKSVKTLAKAIKQMKEKFTEPAKAIIAQAKEMYDAPLKQCLNAEEVLKSRANKYMSEKEAKRIEEERKIAARVEKGTMRTDTAMKKIEALPEVKNTISTNQGSKLRMVKRSVAVIENPDLIPEEFWVIDEVRVRKEALARNASNMPQIPGVKIVEESSIASL
jgi:hypothetical protein